jgi:hypothetical protein
MKRKKRNMNKGNTKKNMNTHLAWIILFLIGEKLWRITLLIILIRSLVFINIITTLGKLKCATAFKSAITKLKIAFQHAL